MYYVICALACYLVGTVNPSYLIAKMKGFDIRKSGSGNAGGSNAVITMGGRIGVMCTILDILKAFFVVTASVRLLPELPYIRSIASVAVMLGHMFPFYMGFKGGKGLACLGGSILAFDALLFVFMVLAALALAFITDYIVFVPLTASVAFPIAYGCMSGDWVGAAILIIATVAIYYRHLENIRRIKNGTEAHLSFMWNKDKEMERIKGAIATKGNTKGEEAEKLSDPEKLNLK
ncbi:MAG: glycerol-3-phosphate acyltransferase [Lachnospiraceae bacterium]|nr:glycerol-3-phosphate acyltransferase [Lachnospiraceae bacterium]